MAAADSGQWAKVNASKIKGSTAASKRWSKVLNRGTRSTVTATSSPDDIF